MDKINEDGYRVTNTHVFFYKKWLSNFGKCKFRWRYPYLLPNALDLGEQEFFCTEQAFMWAKALYFRDFECAEKILAQKESPMACKNLGRQVKNYDDKEWNNVRYDIMMRVNLAKYQQNKDLCKKLFNPDFWHKTFVEASPIDCIWGVGLDLSDDKIVDPKNWKGQNLLGKALTDVRDSISIEGMCKVKDLIDHLKQYDPEAHVLYAEMNAFDGGMWQHFPVDKLKLFAHSVTEDKQDVRERYKNDVKTRDDILNKDYIYAKDNDVVIRF